MQSQSIFSRSAPDALRWLLWAFLGISTGAALLDPLFEESLQVWGPQRWLSLSWTGVSAGYLWQLVTYAFVLQPAGGLDFFFFIQLFFSAYILWMFGQALMDVAGVRSVLWMLGLSTVLAGLGGALMMSLTGFDYFLAGPTPPIFACLLCWTMLHPEAELLLFFVVPILARWMVAGILGMSLLIAISQGHWTAFIYYFIGAAVGYVYAVTVWGWRGPYAFCHPYDRILASWGEKVRAAWPFGRVEEASSGAKIFDFRTGRAVLRDDEFMDAMLDKISKRGKGALSWRERWRMYRISQRKRGGRG